MCGETGAQTQLQGEQLAAYQQGENMLKEQYGDQGAVYGALTKQYGQILANGPSTTGFSQAEETALESQAKEGTAENFKNAAEATGESLAAEGGGTPGMPSGAEAELKTGVGESAAKEESSEENQITQANYNQGYQQWLQAGQGLQQVASGENPVAYEGAATGAGSAAGTTAEQIASEQNSWINAAIGAAGSVGAAVASAEIRKGDGG